MTLEPELPFARTEPLVGYGTRANALTADEDPAVRSGSYPKACKALADIDGRRCRNGEADPDPATNEARVSARHASKPVMNLDQQHHPSLGRKAGNNDSKMKRRSRKRASLIGSHAAS